MVQRYEQMRRLQWYKRGAAYGSLQYGLQKNALKVSNNMKS